MLKNLRILRESANISQKQLADAVGVSQQSINKYENHKIEPDIETLIRISDYFNTSVDYLIGHIDSTDDPENPLSPPLSKSERDLISGYRRLNKSKKDSIHFIISCYNE